MTLSVSLSLSVYCRWPGTARSGARQTVEVRFLICLFCNQIARHLLTDGECQIHHNNVRTVSGAFSSCITLTSCFTERGLERTTSFCLTSGNLQAMFSAAVSQLKYCAVLGDLQICAEISQRQLFSMVKFWLSTQARTQGSVSDCIHLANKCLFSLSSPQRAQSWVPLVSVALTNTTT